MSTTSTEQRRAYCGFASYKQFLNNDQFVRTSTKWHRLLRKKKLKVRPLGLSQEGYCLFLPHDVDSELLASFMSLDLQPLHKQRPSDGWLEMLRRHNVLAYLRRDLEAVQLPDDVEERVCAFVAFTATEAELDVVLPTLDFRIHAPMPEGKWISTDWTLDREPPQ